MERKRVSESGRNGEKEELMKLERGVDRGSSLDCSAFLPDFRLVWIDRNRYLLGVVERNICRADCDITALRAFIPLCVLSFHFFFSKGYKC
ncbi:hypothetical protein TNIN_50411 [Trichonephila inaurata madagascariensis]|uniref:Uncharacterized protein n=1 Tax=Trichonephila inaurata madagascariensis TaxID=2747483 RepID=A0A8X6XNL4_9ARAC|nr:hypothetical protein TNIN_50411 [Trichonephila inaurata madagascariensis]